MKPIASCARSGVATLPVPIAQIGSYAITTSCSRASGTFSSASCTWWRSLRCVSPASYSSSVSPTHSIGCSPASSAAGTFSARARSVSLKCCRRSECPSSTPFTPSSTIMGADTSPVYAPSGSWCMFCASTLTSEPPSASTVAARAVNGGHSASSTPLPIGRRDRSRCTYSRASAEVLYIFQLPAMYCPRASGIIESLHPRQRLALEQLERGAAARGEMRDLIREAELHERGAGVAAAHDRRAVRTRHGLRHGTSAGRERRHLEGAHRAVPEDRSGARDLARVGLRGARPDVETHPAVGHVHARQLLAVGVAREPVRDHEVDRQQQR